jgi:hypothetical protein
MLSGKYESMLNVTLTATPIRGMKPRAAESFPREGAAKFASASVGRNDGSAGL